MTELNVEQARSNMVEQQVRTWEVLDPRVLDVLGEVPRERFVPERLRKLAFSDIKVPIGHGEVMMPPNVEGRMLQALAVQPGERVMEIGTGTGFVTACLRRLGGLVVSMDVHGELVEAARGRLAGLGIDDVQLRVADALQPWGESQAYDAVAVTGSVYRIPDNFREAVRIGGRLFVIVGESPVMEARLLQRAGPSEWVEESLFETDLPYLVGAGRPEEFVF